MLDHVNMRVQDFRKLLAFYRAALAPLGYRVVMEFPQAAGLGEKGKPDFWITTSDRPSNPVHIAFVTDRDSVSAFHAAALAAGATDNGPPGVRADYHPNYFSAFILDPEGNNIEAVCHEPPPARKAPAPRKPLRRGKKRLVKRAASRAPARGRTPAR
jgi:catechol 2,3-dioxygenase-like lactoylglutathione lyase family enzyme